MVAPLHGAVKVIKGEVGCRSSAIEVYAGPSDSRLLVYHVFTTIAPTYPTRENTSRENIEARLKIHQAHDSLQSMRPDGQICPHCPVQT